MLLVIYYQKNLEYKNISNINKDYLWSFYTNYLNLDLNGNAIHILKPEYNIKDKTYPKTSYNVNTYFTKKDLLRYYLKDYKKYKEIKWALNYCKLNNITPDNLGEKRCAGIIPAHVKRANIIYEVIGLVKKIPYEHNRINYMLLDNKNYACHIKSKRNCQNQFVYRLDIDTHDSYFTDNDIDVNYLIRNLIKKLDLKFNLLFSEISVLNTGAHVYIGFDAEGSYNISLNNVKKYVGSLLHNYIESIEQPELHGKLKIDIPSANSILTLPLNSVYEYYNVKEDKIVDQITFYRTFIEPMFKDTNSIILKSGFVKTIYPNLPLVVKRLNLKNITEIIEKKVDPEINNDSGWEKQKGINNDWQFYDSNLLINDGVRVHNTKLIINKMLSINHYYTYDQFHSIILKHVITSKDIRKWSVSQLERDIKAWYDYYEKMYNKNSVNSIKPKSFYSNIDLVPNSMLNKVSKISRNLILREYKDNPFKTKDNIESDIINTELLLKEIIGYSIYIYDNNKSKIKSNVKLTRELRDKAESNINLGREWLKALKEHYGLTGINIERLYKLIIDKSGLFERVYYGSRSYLNLNGIRVATTFNFKIKLWGSNVVKLIAENLELLNKLWKGEVVEYSIMCDGGYINKYINPVLALMLVDDTC